MPGSSGELRMPVRMPACRSRRTVANRRSGRGARGSSLRASSASGVVMVMCTTSVLRRWISKQQIEVALDQRGFGDDAKPQAVARAITSSRLRVRRVRRSIGCHGSVAVPSAISSCRPALLRQPAQVLLEQPGGVLLHEDEALEGFGMRGDPWLRRLAAECVLKCSLSHWSPNLHSSHLSWAKRSEVEGPAFFCSIAAASGKAGSSAPLRPGRDDELRRNSR